MYKRITRRAPAHFSGQQAMHPIMAQIIASRGLCQDQDLDWSLKHLLPAQALSGIAKDLNKMSAKASVKHFSVDGGEGLFRWVALLTGSKNTLKGIGFFLGAFLLDTFGFSSALIILASGLGIVLLTTIR